jgi:hypothetical protein
MLLQLAISCNYQECAHLLIDFGARVENVKFTDSLCVIPYWVHEFVSARLLCRHTLLALISIHKFHRTHVTGANDVNVIGLIAKIMWYSRFDNVWVVRVNPSEGEQQDLSKMLDAPSL